MLRHELRALKNGYYANQDDTHVEAQTILEITDEYFIVDIFSHTVLIFYLL